MVDRPPNYNRRISLNNRVQATDEKFGCLGYNNGKILFAALFPRSFEYCIFLWTWHPERLSSQSVISRNSSAVTHCRVITPLFYGETTVLDAKCDHSQKDSVWLSDYFPVEMSWVIGTTISVGSHMEKDEFTA